MTKVTAPMIQRGAGKPVAPRILLNAQSGWGKTSCGAFTPKPLMVMVGNETGYETLLGFGLVPEVDRVHVTSWEEFVALVESLLACDQPSHQTLVIDSLIPLEYMLHVYTCAKDYKSDWTEYGFLSFQKGYETAIKYFKPVLDKLTQLQTRGVAILILGHVEISQFNNPDGSNYHRYVSMAHIKTTWSELDIFADAVLFGQFVTVVTKVEGNVKGVGGTKRMIGCEHRDTYDAKNRLGLPAVLSIPDDPSKVWSTIVSAIGTNRKFNG